MFLFPVKSTTEIYMQLYIEGLGIYFNDADFTQNISRIYLELVSEPILQIIKDIGLLSYFILNRITQHAYPP